MDSSSREPLASSTMSILWNIAKNDWLQLVRDKTALFFTLGFPLLIAIFFGAAFSGGGKSALLPLAVVDQDNTASSRAWIEALEDTDAVKITLLAESEAREKVRKGKMTAMLVIPQGFGVAREQVFDPLVPQVQLGVSPNNKAAGGILNGLLMAQAAEDMQQAMGDTGKVLAETDRNIQLLKESDEDAPESVRFFLDKLREMLAALQQMEASRTLQENDGKKVSEETRQFPGFIPLKIQTIDIQKQSGGPQNSYAISFPQGIVWGILGIVSAFSLSLVSETRQGTMARLLSMPVSRRQILGGKALGCFLTLITVISILMVVGVIFFDISIQNPAVLLLAILASALGFTGLMMLLSVLGKTEKSASGMTWAVLMIMAMVGGGMIPLFAMPRWMAGLGQFSPVQWTVMSFEGALWRQFSVVEVLPYALMLALLGAGGFLLGSYLFERKTRV